MREITITTLENNSVKYLLSDEKLGEGSVGMVYRAQDEQHHNLVAKLSKPNSEESFDRNARLVQQDNLDYFIPIQQIGIYTDITFTNNSASPPADKINAMVMEYGGSNLKATYELLKDVTPTVAGAFKYKVLITLCDALSKAHQQGKYHGDLTPFNVVVGVDVKEGTVNNNETLEDLLVLSEIRLCDRAAIKEVGSIWVPPQVNSAYGQDALFISYFLDSGLREVCPERDFYSFFKMVSWLLYGNEKIKNEFTAKKLDLEITFSADGLKMVYPEWGTIKQKLLEKMHKDMGNYFTVDELTKNQSVKKYPVVLRPIDVFRERWETATLSTLDDLHRMYTPDTSTASNVSYQSLKNKGGDMLTGTEKDRINDILGRAAIRSAQHLNTKIKDYTAQRTSFASEQADLKKDIKTAQRNIDRLTNTKDQSKKLFEDRAKEYLQNPVPSNQAELNISTDALRDSHANLSQKKPGFEVAIRGAEKNIKELDSKITNLNLSPLQQALDYIQQEIKPVLKSQCRAALEKLIS